MQIGIIGLGSTGANMARRLLWGGHQCVVFDKSPDAVAELVQAKAAGASSLSDLMEQMEQPRTVWMAVPGLVVDEFIEDLLPHLGQATSSSTAATPHARTTSGGTRRAPPGRSAMWMWGWAAAPWACGTASAC